MAKHRSLRFQPAGGERKAQVPVGKKQKLTIERLANDGRGIAFVEGRSWFVAGALPGDLPLKPSLAYIKYASLLFCGTSPRQLPARWRMLDQDGHIWFGLN